MKKSHLSLVYLFIFFILTALHTEANAGAVTNVRNKCYNYLAKYRSDATLTFPVFPNPAYTCKSNLSGCYTTYALSCIVDACYGEAQIGPGGSKRVTKSKWNRIAGNGYRIPDIVPLDSAGHSYSDFSEMIVFDSVFNSVRIYDLTGFMSVPLGSEYGNTLLYVVWIPSGDSDTLINTNEVLYSGKVSIESGQLVTEGIFNAADFNFTIDIDSTFLPVYKVFPAPGLTKNLPLGTLTNLDNVTVSVFSEGGYGAFIESDIINPFINADLTLINEGYYNPITNSLNLTDSITVYLRQTFPPFQIVDSARSVLDSESLKCNLNFVTAPDGLYYLDVRHRNSLQTWSKNNGEILRSGTTFNYDFTDQQSKAFGNNMTHKGTKWCIYSGDVNQDGAIELSDITDVFNDAGSFLTGYAVTDLTGDNLVDLGDLTIVFNNSSAFVSKITP